jgi:acyl-homoserine lactone acylase PvdQ
MERPHRASDPGSDAVCRDHRPVPDPRGLGLLDRYRSGRDRRRVARRARRTGALLVGVTLAGLAMPGPAVAVAPARTASFSADDYCLGQCSDILPPGEKGSATLAEILGNQALGTLPAHADDQRDKYANLALGYPSLTDEDLFAYFNDASFGVDPAQVESVSTPRSDVTITRDKATGVAHIRGTTRYGTEYGAGWVAGLDRLWLIDVLRHVGRGQLTTLAGGAPANQAFEQEFFSKAPYTEAELQAQVDRIARSGPRGAQALADINAYLAGLNAYIAKARADRTFPGEYVLAGKIDSITNVGTIAPFTITDLVGISAVVGALFGAGGGGEVKSALALVAAQAKYGTALGTQVWRAFQMQDDPEAVVTVRSGSFSYGTSPADATGVALPDAGSVHPVPVVYGATGTAVPDVPAGAAATAAAASATSGGPAAGTVLTGSLSVLGDSMSNALVVGAGASAGGHPVAVFGPQTGYFAPQLLMLQELQGPGISARGASFAGLNMYVQLGRGQDYSWSATTAGQDIIDAYAVELCDPAGGPATTASRHYLFHGVCTAMDVVSRANSWKPTTADGTAAGSYTLKVWRTKYGLLESTGTIGGKPHGFTALRSTYHHEADSVIGFQQFNDPTFVTGPASFQQAAANVNYTFNWFYVDAAHTAYYNSGANPQRPATVDPSLPILATAANEWVGWDASTNTPTYAGQSAHPQAVDQDFFTNWNNKQAAGVASPDVGDGAVHRGNLLDSLVRSRLAAGTKVTRAELTKVMMQAGLTDLRAKEVLPELLAVIGTGTVGDPATATAVSQLRAWLDAGALRTETGSGSHRYTHPEAVRVMDAWWPLLVEGAFRPGMGDDFYTKFASLLQVDESPSGFTDGSVSVKERQGHKGSSFQYGWWSYVDKDLRKVLGRPVSGGWPVTYCGDGSAAQCRSVLLATLKTAAATSASTVYPGDTYCAAGDQWCADTIVHSPLGGLKVNKFGWQNRPTFQQVVQYPAARGMAVANLAAGRPASASSVQSTSYPAGQAVDGSSTTRWSSRYADDQWLQVDLGSSQQVARVVLRWETAYGKAYRIETSADGKTWTTATTVSAGNGGVDNLAFAARTARYVRMQGVTRATGYGYSLHELEVYAH